MYAIIRTGGKQAKVQPGDTLDVELLKGQSDEVAFTPLLVVGEDGDVISGRQALADAKVRAKVLGGVQGDKVDIFKYKPKTGYRRRSGHRQRYSRIEITGIELGEPPKQEKAAPAEAPDGADESEKAGQAEEV
ncbi:MAG: 50S ribosomal protein L21 [Actinomycetota bacterium]|nr:50S ribosomal protein L21 [Actinomycetota bacterium]